MRGAWEDGDEIGTHFNGHFCGPEGGVGTWSVDQWKSEIDQAKSIVKSWKSNDLGVKGEKSLPFDCHKELIDGRGAKERPWGRRIWSPQRGLWASVTTPAGPQPGPAEEGGRSLGPLDAARSGPGAEVRGLLDGLQLHVRPVRYDTARPSRHEYWGNQMRDGLIQAFDRAYGGNSAPLITGNHVESWNDGTYLRAVEEMISTVCTKKGVHCVSFRQLADWLDVQDPATLAKLGTLDVGQAPVKGWAEFLGGAGDSAAEAGRTSGTGKAHAGSGSDQPGRRLGDSSR